MSSRSDVKAATVVFGFIAGALAVSIFHQLMLALLHAAHVAARALRAAAPTSTRQEGASRVSDSIS